MKYHPREIFRRFNLSACLALWSICMGVNGMDRFVSLKGGHTPPFTNWTDAATNIQDAIDVATAGDVICVTNGIYGTGGKVMAGDLTNRVALDKAVVVRSVNGAPETVIQGQWDTTNGIGPGAVRCAWLTDGAVLSGFTLRGGATRSAGDLISLRSGGGAWCASTNAVVANCIITGNTANGNGGGSYLGTLNNCALTGNSASTGGGSYQGTLNNCTLMGNTAKVYGGGSSQGTLNNCTLKSNSAGANGGGSYKGTLNNCALTGNSAGPVSSSGGGSYLGTLNNCTVTGNWAVSLGGGSCQGTLNNCIVWGNVVSFGESNYFSSTLRYTCASPLDTNVGNIATDPQLLADGVHIAATSPCRTNGNALYTSGTDLDGQTWANPPSMGCDQWHPQPFITLPPWWLPTAGAGQAMVLQIIVAGQEPFDCSWTKDGLTIEDGPRYGGAHTPGLLVQGFGQEDAGAYQVVVSNAFGMATSVVTRVVVHYVDAAATTSLAPYTNWVTAATTIQAAIDAASPGALILVTNGIYATGGKVMAWNLTNRVALDKAVMVRSVNGAPETVIQGQWDTTNGIGPGAVRCAWLTDGAVLSGFTLRGGATRSVGDLISLLSGGGAWCVSTNAVVANCIITGNTAASGRGGGSYRGTLNNCTLTGNSAGSAGGGSSQGTLNNCTVTGNSASTGGGSYQGTVNNCIVWGNVASSANSNYNSSTLRYTCTSPLDTNVGNIATDPQLLADGVHIAASSPCRTNGNALYTSGTDLDGQTWANPPSMGCDQWHPRPVITLPPRWLPMAGAGQAIVLQVVVAGQEPFDNGWTKDGLTIEDGPRYGGAHTPYLRVQGFGLEDAGAYQMVVSNAFGIATSMVVRVGVHCVDAAATASLAPYTNWPTAATTIQAAIDAAVPGAVILVTNGIYATGGKVMAGDLTNRVALDKAVMVRSVNGAPETVIQGQWDMMSANGPGAVRCAWLTDGAVLSGFTLRGGATRSAGDYRTLKYGGGAWCASTNALVANCIITGNTAYSSGGGSFLGTLINCTLARNSAGSDGGGSYLGTLNNCTVTINSAGWYGGGSYQCTLNNCIVWNCTAVVAGPNYLSSTLRYSCAWPLAAGDGNLATDPQLVDNAHLAITSPCRSAGSTLYTSGTDIDGEAWANPPSMGCDEVWEAALTGPLSVAIAVPQTKVLVTRTLEFTGLTAGRVARLEWSFGDGPVSTNLGYQASHAWDNTSDYPVTLTAYNADYPGGVSTNLMVHVVPLELQVMAAGGTTDNLCRLTLSSQAGVDYVVEYATNLVPPVLWKTLHAWTGLGGVIEVEDTNATSTARFYRLLAQ